MAFWSGKKVFVTGHTGFKGSWITKLLIARGARVYGYSLQPPSDPSIYGLSPELQALPQTIGDIRSGLELREKIVQFQPEIVLHLAAQALVRDSYKDPVTTFETNVMGTIHLFEAVRTCPSVQVLVNVTSDKCYDNREWPWGYRENEPMGGKDPYSASKGCAELVTSSYRASYFKASAVRLASARAGNVFGGGDWAKDRLIPDLVRSFARGEPAVIRSPLAVRPWQHVVEPVSGYLHLAEKVSTQLGLDEGWNFGPQDSDAMNVQWIADKMASLWGDGAHIEVVPDDHGMKEAHLLKLDCSKARSLLGWKPRLNLNLSLQWTIDWYKAFYQKKSSVDELIASQIHQFESTKV